MLEHISLFSPDPLATSQPLPQVENTWRGGRRHRGSLSRKEILLKLWEGESKENHD